MATSSEQALVKLDEAAASGSELTRNIKASFSGALKVARVATMIRNALSVELIREIIMPLKETDFGWRTDGKAYTDEQIRDMWVSATLVGAVPVNNEVNMISARMYLAKNYFKRMIREFPGLTDFVAIPGKLTMTQSGALVEFTATWKLTGKPMIMARTGNSAIPVRLNAGMGADGAIGKAERKILAAVFTMITGSNFADADTEELEDHAPAAATTARMVQQTLPEPEKTAPAQTQNQAVTRRIKEGKPAANKAESAVSPVAEERTPWDGDDQPVVTQTNESANTAATQPASEALADAAATTAPVTEDPMKVAGFVKNHATGEFDPVGPTVKKDSPTTAKPQSAATQTPAAAPQPAQATPTAATTPKESAGQGVIEVDRIGKIASIRGSDTKGSPPYRIKSESATIYHTSDKDMAMKAKKFKDSNVPVEIEYTERADGEYDIIDVRPEGSTDSESPSDGGEFEQP